MDPIEHEVKSIDKDERDIISKTIEPGVGKLRWRFGETDLLPCWCSKDLANSPKLQCVWRFYFVAFWFLSCQMVERKICVTCCLGLKFVIAVRQRRQSTIVYVPCIYSTKFLIARTEEKHRHLFLCGHGRNPSTKKIYQNLLVIITLQWEIKLFWAKSGAKWIIWDYIHLDQINHVKWVFR